MNSKFPKGLTFCLAIIMAMVHTAFAQTDPCKDEVKKTKSMYDECMKMDMATNGYAECLKGHETQRNKAERACRAIAAQEACNTEKEKTKSMYNECMKMNMATNDYSECIEKHNTQRTKAEQSCRAASVSKCEDEKNKAKTIYDKCLSMDKATNGYAACAEDYKKQKNKAEELCLTISPQAAPAAKVAPQAKAPPPYPAMDPARCIGAKCPSVVAPASATSTASVAQALRESSLPGGCIADFAYLLEEDGFSMANFVKELPPAVAKVKLQMKNPFGKPKDGDRTSIGLTVGCIKSLPESPAEIQGLLKDISLKAGLNFSK